MPPPLEDPGNRHLVITHLDITQRKLAEEQTLALSRRDSLTGIANREHFAYMVEQEWNRCRRLNRSLTLAIADIDHFKQLNDKWGHLAGDRALKKVARCLHEFARRPGDICARIGGEEFALLWGNTAPAQGARLAEDARRAVAALTLDQPDTASPGGLTLSIGVYGLVPVGEFEPDALIGPADRRLYQARHAGRNRVVSVD